MTENEMLNKRVTAMEMMLHAYLQAHREKINDPSYDSYNEGIEARLQNAITAYESWKLSKAETYFTTLTEVALSFGYTD